MQRHIFSVKSITYAIKGRDILRSHGIKAYMERKSNLKNNFGCGYVIVAYGDREKILTILLDADIKLSNIDNI